MKTRGEARPKIGITLQQNPKRVDGQVPTPPLETGMYASRFKISENILDLMLSLILGQEIIGIGITVPYPIFEPVSDIPSS
jgi:hypothetical protein